MQRETIEEVKGRVVVLEGDEFVVQLEGYPRPIQFTIGMATAAHLEAGDPLVYRIFKGGDQVHHHEFEKVIRK